MLRLRIDGPEQEVSVFLKDFTILPQHRILAVSTPCPHDGRIGEIGVICHFSHSPLQTINEPVSIMFKTADGKELFFTLLKGNVIRMGDIISVTGRATSGLLE